MAEIEEVKVRQSCLWRLCNHSKTGTVSPMDPPLNDRSLNEPDRFGRAFTDRLPGSIPVQ
jgi:hypothetical protein